MLVVLDKLVVEEAPHFLEIFNLLIHLRRIIFNKEVDEDSISFAISHAMFSVVHLPLRLALVVDHLLELVTIFEANESIAEHSKDFMTPEFDDLFLAFVIISIGKEKALEDLRDVPHVVNVMSLLRCGQEILHALIEDVDCRQGEGVLQEFDIVAKCDELGDEDRVVDLSHLLLAGVREVD